MSRWDQENLEFRVAELERKFQALLDRFVDDGR